MSNDKKKFKNTKVGGFLSGIAPDLFKTALSIGGGLLPDGGLLQKLSDKIKTSSEINAEQKLEALALLNMDTEDRANARAMQIAALAQDDLFSKRFIYYLASFWSVISAAYFFFTTFAEVRNERVADTILGFLLGTIIGSVVNYFFGSSAGSKDKMNKLFKK